MVFLLLVIVFLLFFLFCFFLFEGLRLPLVVWERLGYFFCDSPCVFLITIELVSNFKAYVYDSP